jgi:hypothetical protein
MVLRGRKSKPEAVVLWTRRADALKAGSILLTEKPDREVWTHEEVRIWRYARAISSRMDRMH